MAASSFILNLNILTFVLYTNSSGIGTKFRALRGISIFYIISLGWRFAGGLCIKVYNFASRSILTPDSLTLRILEIVCTAILYNFRNLLLKEI